MDSLRNLEDIFARFPGIGPRQAKRFVYYILSKSPSFITEFISLIEEVRKATSTCTSCHRLFMGKTNPDSLCTICIDTKRIQTTLMIVARDSDFETVEKSGAYQGLYFILGGTVPLMDDKPEKRIRLQALLERISDSPALTEIILSFNTTPDGEHTTNIVKKSLRTLPITHNIAVSILGRGLSTGAELEYADSETIRNALKNRQG